MMCLDDSFARRVLTFAFLLFALTPLHLDAQQIHAVRVNVSSSGQEANGDSWRLAQSRDFRHILFWSNASNLVAGDSNGHTDLFVRDRDVDRDGVFDEPGAVATIRVSVGSNGEQGNSFTYTGMLSPDGRFVLFDTDASTFVPGDTNDRTDVFLHDRDTDGDGVFDEPGATRTTRVSEGPGGVQANAHSTGLVMTPDARYVLFVSAASTLSSDPVHQPQIYRKDRTTGALTLVTRAPDGLPANGASAMPSISDDGRIVAFLSEAGNLGGGLTGVGRVYIRDLATGTILYSFDVPQSTPFRVFNGVLPTPGVTPDGAAVYVTEWGSDRSASILGLDYGRLYEFDVRTGTRRLAAEGREFAFAGDTRYIAITGVRSDYKVCRYDNGFQRLDRLTGAVTPLVRDNIDGVAASGSLRRILFVEPKLSECSPVPDPPTETTNNLLDLQYGTRLVMPAAIVPGPMNEDGSELILDSRDTTLLPPGTDNNGANDVYVVNLDAMLDRDADQLDDRWEAATGLSFTSAAGADGADGDPDGDGVTNSQEQAANSHPRGTFVRYLAEGAENAFFSTTLALANAGTTAAKASIRILGEHGQSSAIFVPVKAIDQRTLAMSDAGPLPAESFSMVIESDAPLAIERTMKWTSMNAYGAHAEHAVADLSTTWFLAEGSTTGEFSLFYLLQNPHDTGVHATIRYLRPAGLSPVERSYLLPPNSRTTIPVNGEAPELASTDVSAAITADRPILVERAMYLSRAGQPFAAGHGSVGVTAPAASWYFGEGATGDFFDLFLLVANPGAADAVVQASYLLSDGRVFTKNYDVAANSRLTIWVDGEEIPGHGRVLANVDVSTVLTSMNGAAIVAERVMWFPGPSITPMFWSEAHVSAGVTATATRWIVADAFEGGPANVQTFVLIANTSDVDGHYRLWRLPSGGTIFPWHQGTIPANSRLTLPVRGLQSGFGTQAQDVLVGRPAGFIVESVGPGPVAQLVVERSTYWDAGGVTWGAGTNVLATPVP